MISIAREREQLVLLWKATYLHYERKEKIRTRTPMHTREMQLTYIWVLTVLLLRPQYGDPFIIAIKWYRSLDYSSVDCLTQQTELYPCIQESENTRRLPLYILMKTRRAMHHPHLVMTCLQYTNRRRCFRKFDICFKPIHTYNTRCWGTPWSRINRGLNCCSRCVWDDLYYHTIISCLFDTHLQLIVAELISLRISLTWSCVGQQEKRNVFITQGLSIMRYLENLNNLSQLLLIFNYICSAAMLMGGTPFCTTYYVSIDTSWFWISDCSKRNQDTGNSDFSQSEQNEYHDIYRDIQERLEEKHVNKWKLPLWDSKTTLPEW